MADIDMSGLPASGGSRPSRAGRFARLMASPRFQAWAARFPLTRNIVRREGEAMFDLVAGFCHSQILQALVRLDVPQLLLARQMTVAELAQACRVPPDRMGVLLRAAVSLGLLRISRDVVTLTRRGAALAGVPGLQDMIRHHDVLYRDLADPVAFFRGEVATELADFWPYVFGAGGAADPKVTATYSALMADSQALVAQDTLDAVPLGNVAHLMDVGGGTGAFLQAVGLRHARPKLSLFDLPAVAPAAASRFAELGLTDRVTLYSGSFRDDPLPQGADMISLVRVLYDHADDTVAALLRSVHDALPKGGSVLISEPMTGGAAPQRAGDAYFALYCMAMRTGRARSGSEIAGLLSDAGFEGVIEHKSRRPFVTSILTATRVK